MKQILFLLMFLSVVPKLKGQDKTLPNIVFLMSDDHQAFAMGCAGNKDVETPNMDKLAEEGVLFERCYATSPLCMASRASVMTGMYEYKTGCNFLTGQLSVQDWKQMAYPVLLREAGYQVSFAGKWGFAIGDGPAKDVGDYDASDDFDKWGALFDNNGGYYQTERNPNMAFYAEKYPHVTRALAAFGQDFIKESVKDGKPFCLSLSFKAPHRPHHIIDVEDKKRYNNVVLEKPGAFGEAALNKLPAQPKLGRQYKQRERWNEENYQKSIKPYYQLISGVDVAIGMVRNVLEKMGVAENTIIIYTSDNGYSCGAHGLQGKVMPYEHSARIPLIIYDPRTPKNKRGVKTKSIVANIDFSPTILELAGISTPKKVDGKSLVPLIKGTQKRIRNELGLVQNWDWINRDMTKALSVVTEDMKYIYWCYADENIREAEELFDLNNDPYELNNISGNIKYKKELSEMQRKYDAFHQHWVDNCVDGPYYKRFSEIYDRNINWESKAYKKHANGENLDQLKAYEEFVKAIYNELTGANYPDK